MRHADEELRHFRGHFGVKCMYSLLFGQYSWHGMHTQVQQLVSQYMACVWVRALFSAPKLVHPLLIMGLGYRCNVDIARSSPLTG